MLHWNSWTISGRRPFYKSCKILPRGRPNNTLRNPTGYLLSIQMYMALRLCVLETSTKMCLASHTRLRFLGIPPNILLETVIKIAIKKVMDDEPAKEFSGRKLTDFSQSMHNLLCSAPAKFWKHYIIIDLQKRAQAENDKIEFLFRIQSVPMLKPQFIESCLTFI